MEQDELLDRKNKEKVVKNKEKLKFYKNISIEDDKIQQIGQILIKEIEDENSSDEEPPRSLDKHDLEDDKSNPSPKSKSNSNPGAKSRSKSKNHTEGSENV